jgi:Lar family restriction alleviation protein
MINIDERAELLPCPFCGGEPVMRSWPLLSGGSGMRGDHDRYWVFNVECGNDNCYHADKDTEDDAITTWNTRATLLTAEVSEDEVVEIMAKGMEPTYSDTYSSRELIEKAIRALSDNGYKVVRK